MKILHRQRHLSIRGLKPRTFNVIKILRAPLDQVYEESDERIRLSIGLKLNLQRVNIDTLDQLLQIMRNDQSALQHLGQARMNEILNIFKKLNINL
jgi:DNA-directed RNA polymerase alpha subunit